MRPHNIVVASLAYLLPILAQNTTSQWPWQTFKSLPGLEPPVLSINKTGETSPGLLFFPQSGGEAHNYSLNIFREDGELVWVSGYGDYTVFRRTTLFGEPVLAFFKGVSFTEPWGFGYGVVYILDQQYENIYNVTLWNSTYPLQSISPLYDPTQYQPFSWIDMHENLITLEGTMFVGAMNVTPWDLSSIGGPKEGWVVDSIVLELNVTNSDILWQWGHLDHVDEISLASAIPTYPLGELGRNSSYPWGPFHINSIERFEDGSLLISSRHYCSIFKVNRNGTVEWTLNVSLDFFPLLEPRRVDSEKVTNSDAIIRAPPEATSHSPTISHSATSTTHVYIHLARPIQPQFHFSTTTIAQLYHTSIKAPASSSPSTSA
jgi:hypothetical protein